MLYRVVKSWYGGEAVYIVCADSADDAQSKVMEHYWRDTEVTEIDGDVYQVS